jgi:hypothetical protein
MKQANVKLRLLWTTLAVVFVLCAVIIYVWGFDNYFVSDDWNFLYAVSKVNTLIELRQFLTFNTGWFVRPAQWVSTWMLFKLGSLNPLPYHLFSLIVNLSNVLLLIIFVLNLHKIVNRKHPTSVTNEWLTVTLIPALFLLSWRHHEAVFWYSSINEPMAAFFRLFSMLCVSFWLLSERRVGWLWIVGGVASYALALGAKESAFILPAEVALLFAFAIFTGGNRHTGLVSYLLVMVCFLVVFAVWLVPYLRTSVNPGSVTEIERSGLTLMRDASPVDVALRFIQFLNGNYLGTRFISSRVPLMVLEIPVLLAIGTLAIIRKRYLWLFAILWIMVAALPYVFITSREAVELGLPPLILGFGDRFLYYSAAGASLLLAVSFQWVFDELGRITRARVREMLHIALALVVTAYLGMNVARLIRQENAWDVAGQIGAGIIRQIQAIVPNPINGEVICISDLPDNNAGAYIFRNGINVALYLAYSRDDFHVRATVQPYSIYQKPSKLNTQGCTYLLTYKDERVVRVE